MEIDVMTDITLVTLWTLWEWRASLKWQPPHHAFYTKLLFFRWRSLLVIWWRASCLGRARHDTLKCTSLFCFFFFSLFFGAKISTWPVPEMHNRKPTQYHKIHEFYPKTSVNRARCNLHVIIWSERKRRFILIKGQNCYS